MENLPGVLYTLLLIVGCGALGVLAAKRSPEIARKIVHIGVAHWYFVYVFCFTSPIPALAGLAAFACINGALNVSGGLSRLFRQDSTKRNWGLVWYPVALFVLVLPETRGVGDRCALGCAMLGMGWGDGLAALIGTRYGRRRLPGGKSLTGFCVMFSVVAVICAVFTGNLPAALFCALFAAVLELVTPLGLDNLSVPFGIYAAVTVLQNHPEALDGLVFGLPGLWSLLCLVLLFALSAFLARRLHLLTTAGAMTAFLMGIAVTAGFGWTGLALFLFFFVSSNALGKLRAKLQRRGDEVAEQKGGARDEFQVAANGLLASLAAIWMLFDSGTLPAVLFGAVLAEATADTWAGELGRLSAKAPRSLLTGKTVPRGISGGVTGLGTASGALGCIAIAALWRLCFPAARSLENAALVCISGFLGCLADSLLGGSLQALYRDSKTGQFTERPFAADGSENTPVRGLRRLNNDGVNFFSNLLSAVFAALGYILFSR